MDPSRVLIEDPCPFGLPEIWSVAHITGGPAKPGTDFESMRLTCGGKASALKGATSSLHAPCPAVSLGTSAFDWVFSGFFVTWRAGSGAPAGLELY